ncbi:hypothetical protein [Dyadobacter psychrotolerans]|uniref:Uncharacterized protein n=1 Tax=Dyadobacter psychrotolerans TaxID=2541721 RepID=A0A4V2Z478_9BACT|nr:hypothetical protein [Dyadobacter psychrotolerans]TDE15548.1 hypothetical protein E0F88_13675 [Dyadobacter psychrotolerans]
MDPIKDFMEDLVKAVEEKWPGCQVIGSINNGNGSPIFEHAIRIDSKRFIVISNVPESQVRVACLRFSKKIVLDDYYQFLTEASPSIALREEKHFLILDRSLNNAFTIQHIMDDKHFISDINAPVGNYVFLIEKAFSDLGTGKI